MSNIIFDLDGTLANIEHRLHYIQNGNKDWDGFYRACSNDDPIGSIIDTYLTLECGGFNNWIFTGRSEVVRDRTREWLIENGILITDDQLIMRPGNDYTPGHLLKLRWFCDYFKFKNDVTFIVDDDMRVIKAFNQINVLGLLVCGSGGSFNL